MIFDKAIEERARTDQEFNRRGFGFYDCFRSLLGVDNGLAGVTRRDLDRIDLSKPLPEGLELVAEILLNQGDYRYYRPKFFGGDEFETDAEEVFKNAISARLKPVEAALFSHYTLKSVYPVDEFDLASSDATCRNRAWRPDRSLGNAIPHEILDRNDQRRIRIDLRRA